MQGIALYYRYKIQYISICYSKDDTGIRIAFIMVRGHIDMSGLQKKLSLGFGGLLLIILAIGIQGILHLTNWESPLMLFSVKIIGALLPARR